MALSLVPFLQGRPAARAAMISHPDLLIKTTIMARPPPPPPPPIISLMVSVDGKQRVYLQNSRCPFVTLP